MFGNPGTVEQGFLDALSEYPQMKYILTLQESVAVLAADGYAALRKSQHWCSFIALGDWQRRWARCFQAKRGHHRWL